ncbi:HipA N-terminal domain-containing protein [Marinobacter nauticus]|uniref:HipA N-terminal domain-containing protein n=1 Tax=Marinobacter nauticus TaxID=2743 RepID=UPI000EB10D99|nr:serine/threonine-protein kinase HipA [Marinobacter nauticus]
MKAIVKLYDRVAGTLERKGNSVSFQYSADYVDKRLPRLSLSLPVREQPYVSENGLPAFFSGLCSEGWLRKTQCLEQDIHPNDEFTLLINNGQDLAGAVTIEPMVKDKASMSKASPPTSE